MRRRPRDFPADSGMGRRMSFARRWRAQALGLVFVIAFLAVAVSVASTARAAPRPIEPAAAMTVTVVLDKSSYLSGDTASATAIVYRTPAPANYTYTWRVRDFFFRLLNQTANGPATFLYPIALSYTGTLRFDVTVNDGQGLVVGSPVQSAAVALAYMALSLDRGDYNPGDTISAYYSVASHVITSPTYTYQVDDSAATGVFARARHHDRPCGGFHPPPPGRHRWGRHRPVRERSEHGCNGDPVGPDGDGRGRVLVHGRRRCAGLRDRPRAPLPPGARRGRRALAARWRRLPIPPSGNAPATS